MTPLRLAIRPRNAANLLPLGEIDGVPLGIFGYP